MFYASGHSVQFHLGLSTFCIWIQNQENVYFICGWTSVEFRFSFIPLLRSLLSNETALCINTKTDQLTAMFWRLSFSNKYSLVIKLECASGRVQTMLIFCLKSGETVSLISVRTQFNVWPGLESSSFAIRINLLHPSLSLILYGLLSSLWCFSNLVNFYFQVSFNWKVILYVADTTQNKRILCNLFNSIADPFNDIRTLKFKAKPTDAFFVAVSQMFAGYSQLTTPAERAVIKSLCTVQTTKQCSAVVVSWEDPRTFDWRQPKTHLSVDLLILESACYWKAQLPSNLLTRVAATHPSSNRHQIHLQLIFHHQSI